MNLLQCVQRVRCFLVPRLGADLRRDDVLRLVGLRDLPRDAILRFFGVRLRGLPRDAALRLVEARFRGFFLIADFRVFERPVFRFRVPNLRDPDGCSAPIAAQSAQSIGFLRRVVLRDRDVFRARVVFLERDVLRALDVFRFARLETDDSRFIFLLLAGDFDADRLVFPSSDFTAITSTF